MQATCSSCGHANPEAARFCGECGSRLDAVAACPDCGTENAPGQRFCNGCGRPLAEPAPAASRRASIPAPAHLAEKIAAGASALAGERKQVTVLFADVQGSMDLAGSLDSEDWRALMDRFLAIVCEGVYRYEGTVNKFTGDGAMALFGAPIAHEDHARRACYAALHLRDALADFARDVRRERDLDFSVRLGMNSGEVVVGTVGDDLHMDYTALGNTVGLAARMEGLAEPGRPYLTRHTAALVDGYFELDDVGELRVKGVEQPVQAYALVGLGAARTRLDAAAARGFSRFVGRDAELAALEAALGRAAGGGQAVAVVADAGLGKSRLCREFADRCRERGMTVTVGTGVAHGRSVPLLPVLEMLRDYFGIGGHDDADTARGKVEDRLLALDGSFRDALPVVFDFLGIADPDNLPPAQMSPEARQRALFATIARLVGAASDERPGVILVEDLHWLDPGSEAFLRNLIEALPGTRTLVLLTFRPAYRGDWMQRSYVQQLPLAPLSAAAIAALVRTLIGDDASLDGLPELIATHTGGNPFFIEEVVHALAEDGSLVGSPGGYRLAHSIGQLDIPPTVHAVLAARIDRLGERDKDVLQAAAVVGHEFSEPVLRRVCGVAEPELRGALEALSRAELVYERALYPVAEYAFRHPLTAEVAYRSQLGERRAGLHAEVARAIEEAYPDRLDELAAVVATHWEQAFDPLAAAQWGARAAAWAGLRHPQDALHHWRRVRDLLAGRHDDAASAGLALGACISILQTGWRLGIDDAEVADVHREAQALAAGNTWALAAVAGVYANARGMAGDVRGALRSAEEARALADELGDLALRMSVGTTYWLALAAEHRAALDELDANIAAADGDYAIGRDVLGFSALVWATFFRGVLLTELGRLGEAREAYEQAERAAVEHDDVETVGWIHSNHGALAMYVGEPGDALAHARASVEIAERLGSTFSRATAYWGLAVAHCAAGEWADALAAAEASRELTLEHGTSLQYLSMQLAIIAHAKRGLGDVAGAREAAAEGAAIALEQGARVLEVQCRIELGHVLIADRPSEARAELERAREICDEHGLALVAWVHEALADLAGMHGRTDAEARQLKMARQLYERQGAHGRVRRVSERLTALPV